jgi:two-component system, chemotaxis family, response regulator PixG
MPKVDGYELCRLLRKHPTFKTTPIIMVTGNTGLIDRAKARLAWTTDYMTKPFTQSELSKMVFRHLT